MLDHVLMFVNEDAAHDALAAYGQRTAEGWQWAAHVIAPQKAVTARAVVEFVDGVLEVTTPEQTIPGFFLTVSLPELSEALRDLPDNACRLIGRRADGAIIYTAPDFNPVMLTSVILEPVPAGSRYFQGGA